MNRWGASPWDNRAAAVWFVSVSEAVDPVVNVMDALHLDVVEYREEVRAAASLLLMLIEAGHWPVHQVEAALELAIARLDEIADKQLHVEDPVVNRALAQEAQRLRVRLLKAPDRQRASA